MVTRWQDAPGPPWLIRERVDDGIGERIVAAVSDRRIIGKKQ